MEKLGQAVKALAVKDEASRLLRLHALALNAARDRDGLPVNFDRFIDHDLPRALYGWFPDAGHRIIVRKMTLGERESVQARCAVLELALEPYPADQRSAVEAILMAMFSGFRAMRQQGDDAEATATIAAAVLAEFPVWAIERGCLKIARQEAGLDQRFAPNDGEIVNVVREVIRPYRTAFENSAALLKAPLREEASIQPRSQRPTYGELRARCAAAGLQIGGGRTLTQADRLRERDSILASTGVSREAWDAIPDAKERP